MFNPSEEYKKQLEWLLERAKEPGWKQYAWERAKELDAHPTGLWQGIANELVYRMKEKK